MEGEHAQLTVTIEAGSDPIAGRLALADGSSTHFEGYMELVAALERLRAGAPTSPPQPNPLPPRPPTS